MIMAQVANHLSGRCISIKPTPGYCGESSMKVVRQLEAISICDRKKLEEEPALKVWLKIDIFECWKRNEMKNINKILPHKNDGNII